LMGSVKEAIESPHANYVLQKIVEILPCDVSSFISTELAGFGVHVAKHRYGCRVLSRLVEHAPSCNETVKLLDEVVSAAAWLCRNAFARHVLQSILEHGSTEHCRKIVTAIRSNLLGLAMHKEASYVVQHALLHAQRYHVEGDEFGLTRELVGHEAVRSMAARRGGCHVIAALLETAPSVRQEVWDAVLEQAEDIGTTSHGSALLTMVHKDTTGFVVPHFAIIAGA